MDKLLKFLKRYALTIWLAAAIIVFTGIISYAAYTSTHTSKSVIATQAGAGLPFSSNYLMSGTLEKCIISINQDSLDPIVNVTICNYPKNNPARFSSELISYTLTAKLVNDKGEPYSADDFEGTWYEDYFITADDTQSGLKRDFHFTESLTLDLDSRDLPAYSQSTHLYSLHYPTSQLTNKNVFICLEAKPSANLDLPDLSRYIGVAQKSTTAKKGWSGGFNDNKAFPPTEYDGFNYLISGSGNTTVTLSWNTKYVEINRWFIEELIDLGMINGVQTDSQNTDVKYIEFDVDSSVENSYTVQFYRKQSAEPGKEIWSGDTIIYTDGNIPFVTFSTPPEDNNGQSGASQ